MTVHTVENDLMQIRKERDDYRSSVDDFLDSYSDQLDQAAKTSWSDAVKTLNKEVKDHAKTIRAKVLEVCPPPPPQSMSAYEKAQLELHQKQIDLLEAQAGRAHDSATLSSSANKSRTLALAKKKYDAFLENSSALQDIANMYPVETIINDETFTDAS